MKVFTVSAPADVEGRTSRVVGVFQYEHDVLTVCRAGIGNMSMGSMNPDTCIQRTDVFESVADFVMANYEICRGHLDALLPEFKTRQEVLCRVALAKLTLEEQKALGLFPR